MDPEQVVLAAVMVLVVLGIVVVAGRSRLIPPGRALIIERGGHYQRTLDGRFALLMLFDRVKYVMDTRDQTMSLAPRMVVTADGVDVTLHVDFGFFVADPRAAFYQSANYLTSSERAAMAALDAEVALAPAADVANAEASGFNARVLNRVQASAALWGVQFTWVWVALDGSGHNR